MRLSLRTSIPLALVLASTTLACVQNEQEPAPGPIDPDEEMPSPCDDYAVGANEDNDEACFMWVGVACGVETARDACTAAVDIASPKGDLSCAWSADTVVLGATPECTVVDRTPRCVAVTGAGADAPMPCEGTARWTHFDAETGEDILVEIACGLEPVPEFLPCLDETAAEACACG